MLARLFLRYIGRPLTWLRYRVEIDGLDKLRAVRGPALVLPNHPGHIDPVLIMTRLGGEVPLRPLVVSYMYRPWYLNPLMRFIDALGQLAVIDGASQGLILIDLNTIQEAHTPYF